MCTCRIAVAQPLQVAHRIEHVLLLRLALQPQDAEEGPALLLGLGFRVSGPIGSFFLVI